MCNPSPYKAEAGGLSLRRVPVRLLGSHGLQSEKLSEVNK